MHLVCPHCQNPVELSTLPPSGEIHCPSCGSGFHVAIGSTTAEEPRDDRLLGKFRLLAPLGSGAFGTVYKAHDTELDRAVAIKVPRPGTLDRAQDRDRFLREARSAAQLRHPSIVSIHEVGQHDGVPFLVSDLVQGVTLAEWLTAHRPTPTQAAQWTSTLADALQHAHAQGVVHRDVKPSNIMLGEQGTLHLMDFGLARRDAGEVTVTLEGQVLGTPAYMSPEQARGEAHQVDGRSDVYSLGVVLYQLLTGELPFRGSTRMLLHQVLHDEPRNPRSLNDRIPRDLETICLKAMAKEPGRRYQTASDMAEDLQRFLGGQPIHARPVGRIERAWRWCRRNPLAASLAAAVVVSLLAGCAAAGYFAVHMARQASLAAKNAEDANQRAEELGRAKARAEQEELANRRHAYTIQMGLVTDAWERGDLRAVQQLLASVVPRPGQEDLRGQDWHYFWQQSHGFRYSVPGRTAFFVDGGRSLATGAFEDAALYDAAGGQLRRTLMHKANANLAIVPLASGTPGVVSWHREEGVAVFRVEGGQAQRLLHVPSAEMPVAKADYRLLLWACAGESGRLVAMHSPAEGEKQGALHIWNPLPDKGERRIEDLPGLVTALTLSGDGKTLVLAGARWNATGDQYTTCRIQLRDAVTGDLRRTLVGPDAVPAALAFAADGTTLAVGFNRYNRQAARWLPLEVRLWDLNSSEQQNPLPLEWPVQALAFSPDGKLLAAGHQGQAPVRVWQLARMERPIDLWGAPSTVESVALSPDGKLLAAGSGDNLVRVWSLEAPPPPSRPGVVLPRRDEAQSVAFSPDGRLLASAGRDHTVRLWDTGSGDERDVLHGHWGPVNSVSFSADGQWLATGGNDTRVLLWHGDPRRLATTLPAGDPVRALAFAPAGTLLAVGTAGGVALHTIAAEGPRPERHLAAGPVQGLAFRPDGKLLATAGEDGSVRLWDVATGAAHRDFLGRHAHVFTLAFSRDGKLLASGGKDGALRLWDMASGKAVAPPALTTYQALSGIDAGGVAFSGEPETLILGTRYADTGRVLGFTANGAWPTRWRSVDHPAMVACVAGSRDGSLAAAGFRDGTLLLLDAKTGKERRLLAGHATTATALACSPDGTILAEARTDLTVRLRDRRTGEERRCLRGHVSRITALAYSADGRRLVTGSQDRTVKVWETRSGELHTTLRTNALAPITAVALSPDGARVAAGEGHVDSYDNRAWVWELAQPEKPLTLEPHGWAVRGLAFSTDGGQLAVATASNWNNLHGNVTLWEAAKGRRLAAAGNTHTTRAEVNRSLLDSTWRLTALAFSPDGKRLATASHDHGIRLWDVDRLGTPALLRGHTAAIIALTFGADGQELVSSARDGTVRFWDLTDRRERFRLHTETPELVALAPDGTLATGDVESGLVRLWSPPAPTIRSAYETAAASLATSTLSATQTQSAQFHLRLAELHARQHEGDKALAAFRSARDALLEAADPAEHRSGLVRSALRLGEALADQQVPAAAGDAFQEAARLQPDSADAQHRLAQQALAADRLEQAVTAARAAVRLNPAVARYHYALGLVLWRLGQKAAARAAFAEALRLDRTVGGQMMEDASAPGYQGKVGEAVALLRELVALQPENALATYRLGFFLGKAGDAGGELDKYREAVRLAPETLSFHEALIRCYLNRQMPDDAVAACRELLRRSPNHGEGHRLLGVALESQGAKDEALASYREAVRLSPNTTLPHFHLGALLADLGRDEEAVSTFREALERQPHNSLLHAVLGRALERRQRLDEAIVALRAAIRLDPERPEFHSWLGQALQKRGHADDAVTALREAVRLAPENPVFRKDLAELLEKRRKQ